MMRLLSAMALALLVAGCATPAPAESAAAPASVATLDAAVNGTANVSHTHDSWEGKERVALVDADFESGPMDALIWSFATTYYVRSPSFGGAFVSPSDGRLVYEGTGRIEVSATWTDPAVTAFKVYWVTPASREPAGGVMLAKDGKISIDVTPDMEDMAHARRSAWTLVFASDPAAVGTFHVRVDAVKTREVGLKPAHPDRWGGAANLTILDAEGATKPGALAAASGAADPLAPPGDALHAERVVPMETATLVVTATIGNAPPGYVPVLDVHRAGDTSFEYRRLEANASSGATYTWRVPVRMEDTDPPYATQSEWWFRVRESVPGVPFPVPPCGSACLDSAGTYHLTVVAQRG